MSDQENDNPPEPENTQSRQLGYVADIRIALGDDGERTQEEFLAYCDEIRDRLTAAEHLLGELASGYWHQHLNQGEPPGLAHPMGTAVRDYWRLFDCDLTPSKTTANPQYKN